MVPFPETFKQRLSLKLGSEWTAFEEAHLTPSPISIRLNPKKTSTIAIAIGTGNERIPWTSHGYYLKERPVFTLDPHFHAGCYYVQEASSMFLEQAIRQYVQVTGGIRALDLCAAPGGKSTHLLSLLSEDSLLVSNEVIRSRVNILSENIQKWGYENVVVTNNDPADFTDLNGFFDLIVVDAPCSGEGLFRKDPDAMQEWSEENVMICSQRQRRIIADIWPSLKENGILVYSTCTYNDSEDEDTLRWIADNYEAEFLPVNVAPENIEQIRDEKIAANRFYPHRIKGEGFFISVIRKKESQSTVVIKAPKPGFATPEKRVIEQLSDWLQVSNGKIIQREDLLQLVPERYSELIFFLTQRLRVVYAGTFVARVKHNKLVPEHSLALSVRLVKENFPMVELNETEALQYLRKDNLSMMPSKTGFSLATFNGVPLGWMNVLPGRINNLYPQEWRIRMRG